MSQPAQQELAPALEGENGDDRALEMLMNRPDPADDGEDAPDDDAQDRDPDDDADEPDESADESEQQPDGSNEPVFEVKIDGKTTKVTQSELIAGYQKDADYRQKTTALAEQRKQLDAHTQRIAQERQYAATQLDVLIGGLHKQLVGDQQHLASLIESDPQEYLRQQRAMSERAAQLQLAINERQALQGRTNADEQARVNEWRKQEADRLLDKLPHWRDEKKRAAESEEIASYLNELGYTADELGELVDHRALLVARDAAKWRAQQRAKAKQSPTATGRVVKPGAARVESSNQSRYADALAKARKTGSPDDVIRALKLKGT